MVRGDAVDVVAALPEYGHELRGLLRDGAADVVSVGEAAEDVEGARREPAEPGRGARAKSERGRIDSVGTHHALTGRSGHVHQPRGESHPSPRRAGDRRTS